MSAVMRILGWKAEGLRCPDHEIVCYEEGSDPYAVTLIQMPNGTGKTTTLELLRGALSGSGQIDMWTIDKVRGFQKRTSEQSDGFFEVSLLLNNRRVTIRMVFDFESGRITYKTTRSTGQQDGFKPPREFVRFMNQEFVELYVFDGELAERLLDRNEVDAELVVEHLFQLNLFESLKQRVNDYWDDKTKDTHAKGERGLSRRRNRLSRLRERLQDLIKQREKIFQSRDSLLVELESKKAKYHAAIMKEQDRAEKLQKAESKVEELQEMKREMALDALEAMRDPHAISTVFAESILSFKNSLDRVKLPESAAKEFFEELANEQECVCGRHIDSKIREVIRGRATKYLGNEDMAFLNSLKNTIHDAVGVMKSEPAEVLDGKLKELGLVVKQEMSARNDVEDLRYEAEKSDPNLKKAHSDIDAMEEKLEQIDEELEVFESKEDSKPDDDSYVIEIIAGLVKEAEEDVAEITETLELKDKRDTLYQILEDAHHTARIDIMKEICEEANERIKDLIPNNDIQIERIDKRLVLEGQEGGSVGETLSIAWGFLATLFHRTEYELPFVVDSPAGPIDLAVRPKIGELIPKLTGQFIAFTISSEREQFVSPLKQASNNVVQFITVFRKGYNELEEDRARMAGNYKETADGMRVVGEPFFNLFQLDEEDV